MSFKTMTQSKLLIYIGLMAFASVAHAEIYKRVDDDGRITYSNVATDNAVKLKIGKAAPKKAPVSAQPSAKKQKIRQPKYSYRSQISQSAQSKRDETRREILLDELDAEKKALIEAQKAYKAGEANPEVYRRRNADGSYATFRNVPKFRAKMKTLKDTLTMHTRNVELLEKEIEALH